MMKRLFELLSLAMRLHKRGWQGKVARTSGERTFLMSEKSAAEGEQDGFYNLGHCYRYGFGCEQDVERAKETFWLPLSLVVWAR
jgi:TPR repeat protein